MYVSLKSSPILSQNLPQKNDAGDLDSQYAQYARISSSSSFWKKVTPNLSLDAFIKLFLISLLRIGILKIFEI